MWTGKLARQVVKELLHSCVCPYSYKNILLITTVLYYSLKSGSLMPPLFIFFLKIAMAVCSLVVLYIF